MYNEENKERMIRMLPNLNDWKRKIECDTCEPGDELIVRRMPSLGFNKENDRYTDLHIYPTFLFQELQLLFPNASIEDFHYRLTDSSYESESLFVSIHSPLGMFVFRFAIYHSEQEFSFYHSINNQVDSRATDQQKDALFQLFNTTKEFLENHSPNRLFLSTQQYAMLLPDIIKSEQLQRIL